MKETASEIIERYRQKKLADPWYKNTVAEDRELLEAIRSRKKELAELTRKP